MKPEKRLLYGIIMVVAIILLCILAIGLILNSYNYYYMKNQVLEMVEERIFFIDSLLSKGQTLDEIDFIKGVVVQNKLNRVRNNLERMPSIPLTYRGAGSPGRNRRGRRCHRTPRPLLAPSHSYLRSEGEGSLP